MRLNSWALAEILTGKLQQKVRVWLYLIPFYLALASLALMAVAVIFIWKPPHDGLNWSPATYEVTDVDQAGPAAEAGFQAGDVIVELDGVPIEEVYPLYEGKRAGDSATFSVLRDGRPLKIEITLERPSARAIASRLEPLLIALCFWLLSTALLALKPTSGEMRLFFLFSQPGVLVLSAGQLPTLSVDLASRLFHLLFLLPSPSLPPPSSTRVPKRTTPCGWCPCPATVRQPNPGPRPQVRLPASGPASWGRSTMR